MASLLQFDGASKGNPGEASSGAVLFDDSKGIQVEAGTYLGTATNNQAEWAGLVNGLEIAIKLGIKKLRVEGDSLLIVSQVLGTYKVKNAGLKPYYEKAILLIKEFDEFSIKHVLRKFNIHADGLANEVLLKKEGFYRLMV